MKPFRNKTKYFLGSLRMQAESKRIAALTRAFFAIPDLDNANVGKFFVQIFYESDRTPFGPIFCWNDSLQKKRKE